MAYQPLDSSPAPVAGGNMRILHPFDPRKEYTIPLPEGPSPGDDAWSNQVAFQQRYAFPPEQAISGWHGPHLNNQSDVYGTNVNDAKTMQHTLPGDGNSPSSIEQCSLYGEPSSYDSSITSYSGSGSIDPRLTQKESLGSLSQYSDQNSLTGMPQVASPGQLSTGASGPASVHYQNASTTQATGYTPDPTGSYFPNPNYRQSLARQRQQSVSSPQGWEPYPSPNAGDSALSPHSPYQSTYHHENQDTGVDNPNPGPHFCGCGAKFGRLTDLDRHRRTSRTHNKKPRGPACSFHPCSYPSKFTRADNFKAHCIKQHGVSPDEADALIREWKDLGEP